MTLVQAIFMGIIQGLTEFLPVSSSGHLALFKILFGVKTDTGMLFDVLLHVGTLAAICTVYYRDIAKLFIEGLCIVRDVILNIGIFFRNCFFKASGRRNGGEAVLLPYRRIVSNGYRKFVLLILVSTIPTGVIGYVGKNVVEQASEILLVPGICLILTGVLLLIADHAKEGEKLPKNVTYSNAFLIGISQGVATLPGLSRSGTTITACLISGFNRKFAVKYSFIMSIPAILGAMVLELKDFTPAAVPGLEISYYAVGMVIAAVLGYICIKTMLFIVKKQKFTGFAIYCFIIGAVSIGGVFFL